MRLPLRNTIILIVFILLKFILQFNLIDPVYELHRDEFLYLDQANHLAAGYASVPPLISCISFIIKLLGNSIFWVKFFPALFGALTMLVVWKAIEALRGDLFALILGATCVLFSLLLRLNTLYQPNSFDVLCWTTIYYIIIMLVSTRKAKWFYIGAVVFALGFLNKYNIVFLIAGILPAMLLTAQRKLLMNKHSWFAVALGIVLILPNLIWQYQNDFPVLTHMKELADTQLVNVSRSDFLKSQLLFFPGALLVIISGLIALLRYKPFAPYRLFFWSLIFTLLLFTLGRAKDYYAFGIWPIYIAFGAVWLSVFTKTGWKRYLKPVLILIPLLIFIPIYNIAFPNKSPEYIIEHNERYAARGMLRWEDGKEHPLPQDFADMLGWKELARKVDSLSATIPDPEKTLILCDNYGQAGAINFYSVRGLKAVSFNADYINWIDVKQPYTNLIRIKNRSSQDEEMQETSPYFERAFVADSIMNIHAREYGTMIFVFMDAKIDINERITAEIETMKSGRR